MVEPSKMDCRGALTYYQIISRLNEPNAASAVSKLAISILTFYGL